MSWTAVPALTGFRYDADTGRMRWGAARGFHVWSTGFAWGTLTLRETARGLTLALAVCGGTLRLERVTVERAGEWRLGRTLASGQRASVCLAR